jgi:hypothetical protein
MPLEMEKFGQRLWFEFGVTRAQSGLLVNMVYLVLKSSTRCDSDQSANHCTTGISWVKYVQ